MKTNKAIELETTIRPISDNAFQMWSWAKNRRTATMYYHGEFDTTAEVVESLRMRVKELGKK